MRILIALAVAAATSSSLQGVEDLAPLRAVLTQTRATATSMAIDDPRVARIQAFIEAQTKRFDAEEAFRANTALPLCAAVWGAAQERDIIAHEKSNPSGVVNLVTLHDAGAALQMYEAQIKALRVPYASFRKHPFTKWESEGVCVAASRSAENSDSSQ